MAEEGLIEIENLSKSFLEGMEDGAEEIHGRRGL